MPRSLDPKAVLVLVLACDVDKTPQPKIFARNPTINQQKKLMTALSAMQVAKPEESMSIALDAAEICLSGWENMIDADGNQIPFSRENIGEILTIEELSEVFAFVTSAGSPGVDDKKKSE